jgi:hypothetical protein
MPQVESIVVPMIDSEEQAEVAESVFDHELPSTLGDLFRNWEGRLRPLARRVWRSERHP